MKAIIKRNQQEIQQITMSFFMTIQIPLLQGLVLQDLYIVYYRILYMYDMFNSVG